MDGKHTASSVASLITHEVEPDNAEHVLAALAPQHGKPITTRLLDHLPGGRVEWTLRRQYGWTEIVNRAERGTRGDTREALRLILARSETSVPLDVPWVERENANVFAGRRERNQLRSVALADEPLLTRMAFTMNEIEDLQAKLAFAKKTFAALVEHDSPLHPDRYTLEAACGLRERK